MGSPHPESNWTHAICQVCWEIRFPYRRPARLTADTINVCCYCGRQTDAGIYYREDPSVVHPKEAE